MCRRYIYVLIGIILLVSPLIAIAQIEQPAPQFLVRDHEKLLLINGYTGEETVIPLDISIMDRFQWSPDGKYLLAWLATEASEYCLNLYDVDALEWLYSEPIACNVGEAIFSADTSQLIYASYDETTYSLWLHGILSGATQQIYQGFPPLTTLGWTMISNLAWSPTGRFLTFIFTEGISGGGLNELVIMNISTREHAHISAPNTYYAYYDPIWSINDDWFLITLKDESVQSGTMPFTNHQGDVYLVNPETGESYRLTYTPAVLEQNVRWTEDGGIAFTEIIERDQQLTLEQAMNIEVVPYEEIELPEEFDVETHMVSVNAGLMISPDPNIAAWITSHNTDHSEFQLEIGSRNYRSNFTFLIYVPDNRPDLALIGWRPSTYPYGEG